MVVVGSLALAGACTEAGPPGGPEPRGPIDLTSVIGDLPQPVGVAVDPSGARWLFDEWRGLYRFDADGDFEWVLRIDELPTPDVPVRPPYTDLVAIGEGRFAITAIGDGYLLDTRLATMQQYFCYVPDELPPDYDQRTDAVTYDPVAKVLHAQPRTFEEGTLVASQLATYSYQTGVDLEWHTLDLSVAAGGMAMLPGVDGPVLGQGATLWRRDGDGALVEHADLSRHGVVNIDGLALDAAAGTLLVVDNVADRLVEVPLDELTP